MSSKEEREMIEMRALEELIRKQGGNSQEKIWLDNRIEIPL